MRIKGTQLALSGLFLLYGATLSFAQFGAGDGRADAGDTTRSPQPDNIFLGFQPVVRFVEGSAINATTSLFWGEKYYLKQVTNGGQGDWSFGGWFVFKGTANVWSVHSDYWFLPNLSVDGAIYGGTVPGDQGKKDAAIYLAYNLIRAKLPEINPKNDKPKFIISPALRVAVGGYDYASVGEGVQPATYVEGSLYLKPWFSLDATAWFVHGTAERGGIERYGVGFGYRF